MDGHRQRALVRQLIKTKLYQDYREVFEARVGLPLSLCPARSGFPAFKGNSQETSFCALMIKSKATCQACLDIQAKLECYAQREAKTVECFAGLCETAVPVRAGDGVIAYLRTGQVILQSAETGERHRLIRQIQKRNIDVDHRAVEKAYSQVPRMSSHDYQAAIQSLTVFSEQLSALGNDLLLAPKTNDYFHIRKVKAYVEERYATPLTLDEVSDLINVSSAYFCRKFKRATGMTFVEYLSTIRVEKAKILLRKDRFRICDIAFEVGFNSLSQFNRAFFRYTGYKPSQYRQKFQTGQFTLQIFTGMKPMKRYNSSRV